MMLPMPATSQQDLVSALIENTAAIDLRGFIADRRESGLSWQRIADDIKETTEGVVDVDYSTVRRWALKMGVAA